ncbi:MAG: hypothetical protein GTO63_34265 [Anaerolineae bacterium]|nr:hypothetical protein [Anaerolineae bacterium]NIN99705.1 hypothetical protein [Anaerolineae bacterium]NIQ82557.1 hypothetical protein [Anaerolineae bacterium]
MNVVNLSGQVERVFVRDFNTWVAVSLRLRGDGITTFVDVKGIQRGSKPLEDIPKLEGKWVYINGYLNSRDAKAKDDRPARTIYSVATNPRNVKTLPGDAPLPGELGNSCVFHGRIEELKNSEQSGALFAKVGVRYYNPKAGEFGTRWIRVQCPKSTSLANPPAVRDFVLVTGTLSDSQGVFVQANRILKS